MNKEFLDPNTRYSDQKVDLAKMAGLVGEFNQRITALEEGGGGGNSPLIVNSTLIDEVFYLDKTFGEIRTAINAGQTVIIFHTSTSTYYDELTTEIVQQYSYHIGISPEFQEATGNVGTRARDYSVSCVSAPYTLAALDALYPYGS